MKENKAKGRQIECNKGQMTTDRTDRLKQTGNRTTDRADRLKLTFTARSSNKHWSRMIENDVVNPWCVGPYGRNQHGVEIAQLVECRTRDRKVACTSPGRSGGRIFFSRVHFLC